MLTQLPATQKHQHQGLYVALQQKEKQSSQPL